MPFTLLLIFALLLMPFYTPVSLSAELPPDLTTNCHQPACYVVTSGDIPYKLMIKPVQGAIKANTYFDLDVSVLNRVGQALDYPVRLELDAGMPAHQHGMNVKPLQHVLGNSQFRMEGLRFHMPGQWQLNAMIWRGIMCEHLTLELDVQ